MNEKNTVHVAQYMAMGQGLGVAISRAGQAMGTTMKYSSCCFILLKPKDTTKADLQKNFSEFYYPDGRQCDIIDV